MSSRALRGPNEGTGALNQDGSLARHSWRNATRRGQRGQSRPGLPDGIGEGLRSVGAGTTVLGSFP